MDNLLCEMALNVEPSLGVFTVSAVLPSSNKRFTFIFDTGWFLPPALSTWFTQEAGIAHEARVNLLQYKRKYPATLALPLRLGDEKKPNIEYNFANAFTVPDKDFSFFRQKNKIAGIIGFELLEKYCALLDPVRQVLFLGDWSSPPFQYTGESLPVTRIGKVPAFPALVSDEKGLILQTLMYADSGANASSLHIKNKKLNFPSKGSRVVMSLEGDSRMKRLVARGLLMGSQRIEPFEFLSLQRESIPGIPGALGCDMIRQFVWYFDLRDVTKGLILLRKV